MKLINMLGILVFVVILALITSPLWLVIRYPEGASHFTEISEIMIPWLCFTLLMLVFNESVKEISASISGAIGRLRKVSAAGATTEFDDHQKDVLSLTKDQTDKIAEYIQSISQQKDTESAWAWHFFIKYVAVTIYGSQIKLLQALKADGAKKVQELLPFYNLLLSREPNATSNAFAEYVGYLTTNVLIQYDESSDTYGITNNGERFLEHLATYGLGWETFRG